MGRPTKLTPDVQRRICQAIAAGNYREAAAAYGGVQYQTLLNWMERGKHAKSGVFFEFFEAIQKAEAEAEVRIVTQWQKQIPEHWQAARDFLARRYPQRWGPKEHLDVTIRRQAEQIAAELGLSVEEVLAEAERLVKGTP